jgi:membrane protease subunit HflK
MAIDKSLSSRPASSDAFTEQCMAWNEPGGKRRDPWQGGGGGGGGDAPDLDAMLKRLRDGFGRVFGGGGGGAGVWILVVGVVGAWFLLDSWRTIDETQRGVVLRFGQFDRLMQPGLRFKWPSPIEQVLVVDATRVRSTSDQVRILTRDENIISVEFSVQYTVGDPRAFLFAVRDPDETIRAAAESAVRQVIGDKTMDQSFGQLSELSTEARGVLQSLLDEYSRKVLGGAENPAATSFFTVGEFNFQNVRPPPEVKEAFDDAISAREDKQRLENEARAYASKIVPEARGQAARIRAEAEGARDAQVAVAEGEAQRFSLLAAQYRQAPDVTRKRLMLETMQELLAGSPKVIVEGGGENVLYLPLDRLGQGGGALPSAQPGTASPASGPSRPAAAAPVIDNLRGRDSSRTPRDGRN